MVPALIKGAAEWRVSLLTNSETSPERDFNFHISCCRPLRGENCTKINFKKGEKAPENRKIFERSYCVE